MGRWTDDYDHNPSGMKRIAYDSDRQRYIFRSDDGTTYEGGEYGGDLRKVSSPHTSRQDNEPIRLFPTMPSAPVDPRMKSPTSPTSFSEMLPPHLIAAAPPMAPPTRNPLAKHASPSSPTTSQHSRSESGSRRSLWGVVRNATRPSKMRDVVEAVVRRPSALRREGDAEGAYARLSNSREDERAYDSRLAQDPSSSLRTRKSNKPSNNKSSGHAKRPTA